jgi:hypothetical protein
MTLEALAGTVRDPALALERMELRGVRMQRGLRGRLRTLEHGSGAEFNRLTGSATAPVRWVQREVYATGTSSAEEVEKQVERFLERLGLPSRERLDALAFEIESLSAQIDQALALIAAEEQRAK